MDQVAGFEHGKPALGGVGGDACLAGQRGDVEQLPCAASAEAQETLKGRQVLNVQHLPDVTLGVGGDVTGEPVGRLDGLGMQCRVAAHEQGVVEVQLPTAEGRDFRCRKRQQPGHAGLAWPRDRQHGQAVGEALQRWPQESRQHSYKSLREPSELYGLVGVLARKH